VVDASGMKVSFVGVKYFFLVRIPTADTPTYCTPHVRPPTTRY